jgi:hypothetical protein
MMTPLGARVVEAYGGRALWEAAREVRLELSAWGWAFRLKWRRPLRRVKVLLDPRTPSARITPIDRRGNTGLLDGTSVRLENAAGELLASRLDPRSVLPYGRRALWWDTLDQTYFAAYAAWNYFVFPALLLRHDIAWTQVSQHTLRAHFPPYLPTHCPRQDFHIDARGRLRQHDYTAEVFGGWARAAHVVREHATSAAGICYTSRRRVTPRQRNGSPAPFPLLVAIEVHAYEVVR